MNSEQKLLSDLGDISEKLFGPLGRELHDQYLGLFAAQLKGDDIFDRFASEEGNQDSLPEIGALERQLGRKATDTKYVKPRDIDRMREDPNAGPEHAGGHPSSDDLSRPGTIGWPESKYTFDKYRNLYLHEDGTWSNAGYKHIDCGKFWGLKIAHYQPVQKCEGVNYQAIYRETLLRCIAEAHRVCVSTRCETPLTYLLFSAWGCQNYGQPRIYCTLKIGVVCTAV